MDSAGRYKLFRNFMVNELGISREDIKDWTIDAIRKEVEKLVGQINITEIVVKEIKCRVKEREFDIINKFGVELSKEFKITSKNI